MYFRRYMLRICRIFGYDSCKAASKYYSITWRKGVAFLIPTPLAANLFDPHLISISPFRCPHKQLRLHMTFVIDIYR